MKPRSSTQTWHQVYSVIDSRRCLQLLIVLLSIFTLVGCSSSMQVTSQWSERGVTIDGVNSEWQAGMMQIGESNVYVGVRNDLDYLYVCVTTADRQKQRLMLLLGCTLWLDPSGGKEKTIGIHFPIGMLQPGQRFPIRDSEDEFQRFLQISQRELELLGPEKDQRERFGDKLAKGVDAHLGYADGVLTYEVKVALRKSADHPFAVSAEPLRSLSVGLETGLLAADARSRPPASGRAMDSQPRGRSGGRSGAGRSSSAPAIGGDGFEPLNFWAVVQLAGSGGPQTK